MLPNRRERRKATGVQPDSPETKRLKAIGNKAIQKQAFKELLQLREKNGGNQKYGDYEIIFKKYQLKKIHCVNIPNLRYRMKNFYLKGKRDLFTETDRPSRTVDVAAVSAELSPLTVDEAVVVEDTSTAAEEKKVKRGRKVGTSVAALNASELALKQAKTSVATLYLEKKRNAASKREKVPAGWLTDAIDIVEQEFGVPC
jgi:hypothetical protein